MIEAAGWVMEVLVSEEVDVDTALGFVHLSDLGANECGKIHNERKTRYRISTLIVTDHNLAYFFKK